MAREFCHFPEQYDVNVKALEEENDEILTGVSILKEEYIKVKNEETK